MVCNGKPQAAGSQITSFECVERARQWADALVWRECSGPRDLALARSRVEAKWGIPAQVLKDLRERPPKRIDAALYLRLQFAHRAQIEREIKHLNGELAGADERGAEIPDQDALDARR